MAVGTEYLTLIHFCFKGFNRRLIHEIGDFCRLCLGIYVVKLHYSGVCQPTVNAWMLCQVLPEVLLIPGSSSYLRMVVILVMRFHSR